MAARTLPGLAPTLARPPRAREICLELEDNSTKRYNAVKFFGVTQRDPFAAASRLAEQFADQNERWLSRLDVRATTEFTGREVCLRLDSGNPIGAIPLLAPTSAQPDLGLVIQPRFPWKGIGPMLATMGWRVTPAPLKLPLLRRSERRVPAWVLSSTILMRLRALLDELERKFEMTSEIRTAPRGRVDWLRYATASLARGKFLDVPCHYPDLREDRELRGAIRFTLERQRQSLGTQRQHGAHVHRLLDVAEELLRRLQNVTPLRPAPSMMASWQRRPLTGAALQEGLQAVEWTVHDRGLAGLSDLEGIPWALSMDLFFEAWVETVFTDIGRRLGCRIRVGRKRETTQALRWTPGWLGSQQSLVPDLMIECDSFTMIVDAKYKRHWEEMGDLRREDHRHDLLQVLAYANLAARQNVVACLVYPCRPETWESLRARGALIQRTSLNVATRSVEVWLTAMPMSASTEAVVSPILERLRHRMNLSW